MSVSVAGLSVELTGVPGVRVVALAKSRRRKLYAPDVSPVPSMVRVYPPAGRSMNGVAKSKESELCRPRLLTNVAPPGPTRLQVKEAKSPKTSKDTRVGLARVKV